MGREKFKINKDFKTESRILQAFIPTGSTGKIIGCLTENVGNVLTISFAPRTKTDKVSGQNYPGILVYAYFEYEIGNETGIEVTVDQDGTDFPVKNPIQWQ